MKPVAPVTRVSANSDLRHVLHGFDALPLLHGTRVYGVGHNTSK
jgi:hypothetical protein